MRYSSTSAFASRPSAWAYVRRKLRTNVGPGSRSHSSFSRARRYLARIFVCASISDTSIRARIRASRRVAPLSAISAQQASDSDPNKRFPSGTCAARPDGACTVRDIAACGDVFQISRIAHKYSSGNRRLARRLRVAGIADHGKYSGHVRLADQHLTRLGSLIAGDHAATLQHVDQPARAGVAEAQTSL